MREIPDLEIFDRSSAAVVGEHLERAQKTLAGSKAGEEERVNGNVLRNWERSADRLVWQIAAAIVIHRSGDPKAYLYFPLPKK